MQELDSSAVLNLEQLRDITLDDRELMRELLAALIEDTSRQIAPLESAIEARDPELCARLAHYAKGACANLGANSTAALLKNIECRALSGEFDVCAASLRRLSVELRLLRGEAASMSVSP